MSTYRESSPAKNRFASPAPSTDPLTTFVCQPWVGSSVATALTTCADPPRGKNIRPATTWFTTSEHTRASGIGPACLTPTNGEGSDLICLSECPYGRPHVPQMVTFTPARGRRVARVRGDRNRRRTHPNRRQRPPGHGRGDGHRPRDELRLRPRHGHHLRRRL